MCDPTKPIVSSAGIVTDKLIHKYYNFSVLKYYQIRHTPFKICGLLF